MWADVFGDAGKQSIAGYEALDAACGQPMKVARYIDFAGATVANKERTGGILTLLEVVIDPFCSFRADKYWAILLAFSTNRKFASLEVNVVSVESDEFADAQTTRE